MAELRKFVKTNRRGVLATTRSDGRPQLSPVIVGMGDDGRLRISTRETAMKAKNLRRDPRASVILLNDGFFGQWVQADGTAEVVGMPEAMDLLVDYYREVSGEHPDWDEYRTAMTNERRVLLLIDVERIGPTVSG